MTTDLEFGPKSTTIALGGRVTWKTVGAIEHTVTAYGDRIPDNGAYFASGGFDSEAAALRNIGGGLIEEGENFTQTFETPGRFEYFCIPHETESMTGTIIVR